MPDWLDDDGVVSNGEAVNEPDADTLLGKLEDGEVDWLVGDEEPRSAPERSSTLDTLSVLVDGC